MSKTVEVNSIIRKLYVSSNGKEIEVKQIENPQDYNDKVTLYVKEAVKGASKGAKLYCVAVADYVPKTRTTIKESMKSLLAQGLTAEELQAKILAMYGN